MKPRTFFCVLFCLCLVVQIYAQGERSGDILFDMDMASFRAQDEWSFVEIYFSVPRADLKYEENDEGYEALFDVTIQLFSEDSLLTENNQQSIDKIGSLDDVIPGQYFYKIFNFYVKEGQYKLVGAVKDLKSNKEGWYDKNIQIESFSRTDLTLSDIQLSTSIVRDTSKNIFAKNDYRVIPNPSRLYGVEVPTIYYYAEIYNLSPLQDDVDSTYALSYSIKDMEGKITATLPKKVNKRMGSSIVEVGKVDVMGLMSGSYSLVIEVVDKGTGMQVSKETPFFIYRRVDFVREVDGGELDEKPMADPYEGMTEEELNEMFGYCTYIVTRQEKKSYKKLGLDGKRKFMREFWKKHDNNLLTPENEYKDEYMKRVWLANNNYTLGNRKGWKTDRGRILVIYGEPNEIERHPSSMDVRPYEIWQYYEVEGGVIFVFVDIQGFGEFRLVHSTARDQLQDYEWERWLQ